MTDFLFAARPFVFFAYIVFMIYYFIQRSGKKHKKTVDDFWETEHKANQAAKQNIPDEMFYTPDISGLPFKEYEVNEENKKLIRLQNDVINKSNKKMLQFEEKLSNTELKFQYGAANIQNIVIYEQNYENFIRALNSWSKELLMLEQIDASEKISEYTLSLRPLIFDTYAILIDIYIEKSDKNKLILLRGRINDMKIIREDEFLRNKIEEAIQSALEKI